MQFAEQIEKMIQDATPAEQLSIMQACLDEFVEAKGFRSLLCGLYLMFQDRAQDMHDINRLDEHDVLRYLADGLKHAHKRAMANELNFEFPD